MEDTIYEYIAACDALDADRVSALLADADVDFAGQHASGAADLRAMYASAFSGGRQVRHLLSNVRIRFRDADQRRVAHFTATYVRWSAQAADGPLGLGDYSADLECIGDVWRFKRLVVRRLWSREPAAPVAERRQAVSAP